MSIRELHIPPKKTARQNSGTTSAHSGSLTEEAPVSFLSEISDIMRGFGDCESPLLDSVQLVEKIVHQQLRDILNEATAVATRRRGATAPTLVDFEFLMRNKPVKIHRMRKHIRDMRLLRKILNIQAGRVQGLQDEQSGQSSDEEIELEVPEKFDDERTRRLFRADRISQILTGQQYTEFNEARRVSFYCRHGEKMKLKFRAFLGLPVDIKLPNICLSILAYLAHETVATLVDYAILTRLDSENRITEPYSRVTSTGASYAMMHLCPEVTQGRGLEAVKPITVQEIQEGLRRYNQMTKPGIGFYRNTIDAHTRKHFLAI